MKKNLYQLLLPLLLLASWGARAQTPLQSQSFENGETVNYTASTVASGNSNIYFTRASLPVAGYTYPSGLTNIRDVNGNNGGTYFWASENVRRDPNAASPVRANPPANLTLNALNVTGKSNFSVKVALADAAANNTSGTGWETNDFVRIQYRFDGGTWANATGGQFVGTRNEDTGVPSFGPLVQDADGNGVADSGGATLTQALTDYTFAIPGSGSTLEVRVQIDQDGASEEFGFDAIRVYGSAAASAAPVLSNLESTALNYAEGQGAVPITNTLTISDDGTTLTGARVAISANFQSSEDQLVFINQNGITGSYNTGTGVLTMSGTAAVATYQAALRSIQYQNTDTKDASPLTRTVSFSVTDATNVGSNTVARNIAVTTALDTPGGLPYAEDLENGDGEGTRYATNKATATLVNGRYFNRTNVTSEPAGQWHANGSAATTISGINNSYYWWVSGSSVLSGGVGTFTTKQTNTAGYYNLNFSVKLAASNNVWENGQYLRVSYRLGGSNGTWQPLLSFRSTDQTTTTTQNSTTGNLRQDANPATTTGVPTGAQLTPTLTTYSAALPASANGQLVDFRIEALSIASDGVGEVIAFDNLQLTGSPIVAPTVTTGTTGTITTTTAAVNNNTLSSDGGASLTDYGVVYVAGTGTPTTSNTKVQVGTSSPTTFPSSFAANLTGLTPGTQYTVRAYATNSVGTSYGANVTFTTATPTITLAPASPLPGGTVATAYSQTLTASGGTAPYSYAITAGALPAGLTLTSAGVLSGTPTAGGTFSFRVNATDAAPSPGPFSGSQAYSLTIAAPTITVAPASLPNGATNTAYSQAITASGGTAPYSYAITAGALPAGLTLTAAGVLSGTPTASGSFTFTVTATDASTGSGPYSGSRSYTLPIANSTVTVTSVTRLTPSPTATATVSYRVVFSGTVTGLSTSNFSLTTTGLTGATISALSGSGTTYTVVVNTGTGNGTLRLDVANSTGTTPSITNVPYTAGEEYTIAKDFAAAPTLRIQAAGSAVGNSDVTAFVDVVQVLQSGTSTVVPNGVQNGSFETNNVATNFKKTADGVVAAPWTFTSTSGISRNGGDFASTAFDGTSVALIQSVGDNNASISQNLAVPTGSYQVSFQAIQRNYTSKDQRLNVFLVQGGNTVFIGNIQPNGNFPPTYDTFTSASFSVTAPALVTTVSTSSASPTSSSLIPFGVSFTASGNPQSVGTTFTASDVTVSGGTLNAASFSGSGAGPYTFTVTPSGTGTVSVNVAANVASDANNTQNSASNTLSVQFVTPTITVAPAALPDGTRGTAYSQTLSASGGTAPYTYAITAGALPVGLSLSSAGVLAGTPAVSGTFTFTVTATDNSAAPGPYSGSRSYTLSIGGPAITLAPATLPAGTVAVAYSQTITASGGTAPYTYAITAGALPAGLTLTSAGVLAGTPTAGGTFNFTVTAFDASTSASGGPYTGSRSYALTIAAPTIAVGPTSLPNGTQGTAYGQALSASGGTAPYTYAITAGALPSGLSLSSSGTIAGTPTTNGTFNFTVTATDASTGSGPYTGSRSYTLVINSQPVTAAPVVTTPANNSFSNVRSVTVTGTAPAGSTVSIYIGSNLAGTTPASATGAFSYLIPGNAPDGTYTVSATAQSSSATTSASSNVNTFTIDGTAPTVTLSSATVASGNSTSTSPVSFTATFNEPVTGFTSSGITVTNGTVTSGPTAGSGNTYTFQVTPRGAGNVTVTVLANAAQDRAGNNNTASSQYAFTFQAPTITVAPATLPNGTQGTAYSQALSAAGGTAPYTYAITAGALPAGLSLNLSNGTIAGTPTTNGNFTFTVTATDASAAPGPYSGARSYTLTISTQPVTAAPVVTAPANGSLTNSNSVTYQGTAPAGSTVTVYVDGTSIGVTTATGGNWSLVQPTALAQGSHTVYATAQASGSAGSANSNTNTFTVDSVRPSVAISSSAGASGGSTSTSPIPYTVTFSKNVTGFVAGDVSVTGGTLSGFTAVSGITYTFNVTPSTSSSTVTVNIAANVAVDQAGNGNTAASQYSLTFLAPTITVAPATLPNGTQGTAYSQALSAAGGTAPYSYSITSGALPAGLSLNLSNGTIAGTPTANGTFNFTVTATDASIAPGPYSGSRSYTLTVAAPAVTSVTWTGNTNTDWFNASNWSPSQVPDATIDAVIPTAPTGGRFPVITSNTATAQVRNLTINSGATLTQTNNVLALAANLTNNGTFRATSGTVILGNTSQSNILGASNTRFWNLTVGSNGAQQSTSASTSVQRLLTLNGNFAINGNPFTLESNASNTAMVVNNGSNVLTGNVTVQRFIDPSLNPNLGYHHFSSPISNATVGSLATTGFTPVVNDAYNTSAQPGTVTPFPTVYGYDQARLATATNNLPTFDKGWFSPSALSNPLAVGQGYTVNLTANQAFSLTGPQNNGNVALNLARNTGATAADAGLALVGNPYPSPLDWSQVAQTDRPGLDGVIYVFASNDPTNPYAGSYSFYNNGIGSISPVLPLGQGFFVRVSNDQAAATLTFKNSHRPTTYSNNAYRRTAAETRPLVQLTLKGTGSAVSDDAFVYFEQGSTEGFDAQYDAVKLPNPNGLNLSASVAGKQLSIDGLPELGAVQRVIPLAVGVPAAGSYSLSAAQLLNLDATPVYLRDLQAGTLTDLRLQPSYQFTVSNASALITGRFELVFSPQKALATVPAALAQQVGLYPNPAKTAAFVELPASLGRQAVTATLVDALGRVARTVVLPAQGALAHQLDLHELPTGIYALRLSTSAGVVVKRLTVE